MEYCISSNKLRAVYLFQVYKLCTYYSRARTKPRARTKQRHGLFHSAK